ncbi:hypothetical protein [Vibrio cidicii]|uniref:hypothetical protein n=1 Tax=Vibrio cidicii TaxID=1763883 RepID=UPI00147841A6|nr:hypothetical protein [Vibrio cidicii]
MRNIPESPTGLEGPRAKYHQFQKKTAEIKKATGMLSLSELPQVAKTVLHSVSAPIFRLFFVLSLQKGVVRHHPDEFWLSFDFLYRGLSVKPGSFALS